MAYLKSADLTVDEFTQLIAGYPTSEATLMMAFSPAKERFEKFSPDTAFLATTEQGRIFSQSGELRWRLIKPAMFRVVYIGQEVFDSPLQDYSPELEELETSYAEFYLWGVRTDLEFEWLEQQVPHRFNYPIDTKKINRGRVALVVEVWSESHGIPQFSRYHSIKEVKGEEKNAAR